MSTNPISMQLPYSEPSKTGNLANPSTIQKVSRVFGEVFKYIANSFFFLANMVARPVLSLHNRLTSHLFSTRAVKENPVVETVVQPKIESTVNAPTTPMVSSSVETKVEEQKIQSEIHSEEIKDDSELPKFDVESLFEEKKDEESAVEKKQETIVQNLRDDLPTLENVEESTAENKQEDISSIDNEESELVEEESVEEGLPVAMTTKAKWLTTNRMVAGISLIGSVAAAYMFRAALMNSASNVYNWSYSCIFKNTTVTV